jgi:N-succinyldiaminopimelate aminotransferase
VTVRRLSGIPGFAIDQIAALAGADPDVLRLENLDTDLAPPAVAIAATRESLEDNAANSYLPFTGSVALRERVARRLTRQTGQGYGPDQVVITAGGTEGMLDALLATTDPGDEVIVTDPTYAGMVNRIRLVGAEPRLVPFVTRDGAWRLDRAALRAATGPRTRVVFLMNPSIPSGAVLDPEEWEAVAAICREQDLWLIYNAAMERILFDGRPLLHPAALPGLASRTLVVGSMSKEYRMIGWRTGWVAGPAAVMADVARVHLYNVVTATGIAQAAAAAALDLPEDELTTVVREWQRRRDVVVDQLRDWSIVPAAGGWSMLLDVGARGYDSFTASSRLLERGKVAATPMRDWGARNSDRFVRLVFSNEPVERLATLGERVRRAL